MSVKTDVGPFAIMPLWLLESGVSATALKLFGIMAAKYADQDGNLYPSRRTLAAAIGAKSPRTVDAASKELATIGALTIVPQKDEAGDLTSNLYLLHFAAPRPTKKRETGLAENPTDRSSKKLPIELDPLKPNPFELDTTPPLELSPRLLPVDYPAWAEGFERIEGLSSKTLADLVRVGGLAERPPDLGCVLAFADHWNHRPAGKRKSVVAAWRNWLAKEQDDHHKVVRFRDKPQELSWDELPYGRLPKGMSSDAIPYGMVQNGVHSTAPPPPLPPGMVRLP